MGQVGCAVEHYVWDRASITALDRFVRQWHLHATLPELPPPHILPDIARLTEFVLVTPCALHDSQNAFKWAFLEHLANTQMMRYIYISIESLRNSADLVGCHLATWVRARLHMREKKPEEWCDLRRRLWYGLAVDLETAEILAEDLQLEFVAGHLCVRRDCAGAEGYLVGYIVTTLLSTWRFIKFTGSRWLTLGAASRTLTAALLSGLDNLVEYILNDTNSSPWYLKGYRRLQGDRRSFVVQSALASRVAESAQLVMMEDSRVGRRYDEIWRAATEELKWLVDLSDDVWALLGSVCDMHGDEVKDAVIKAGHVSFHFLWRRDLLPASQYPWPLCRGDIEENLQGLREGSCPDEPVASQLWQLMHIEYPMPQIVESVRLMGELGWTSLPAEQQHGSLALYRRWHPDYGCETLVSRALIMQISRLLPQASADEKRVAKVLRRLQKIEASNPQKAGGKQEFLKNVIQLARSKKEAGDERFLNADMKSIAKHWFARHAVHWAQQSLRAQAAWRERARHATACKSDALRKEMESLTNELELLTDRTQADDGPAPLSMSAAALQDRDLLLLARLMTDPPLDDDEGIAGSQGCMHNRTSPMERRVLELVGAAPSVGL